MSSMCAKLPRISLFLVVLGTVGCAVLPGRDAQPPQRIAGLLEMDSNNASLMPCGAKEAVSINKATALQALFVKIAQPGQTALFVDMTARPLADGGLEPVEIIRMQTTGRGCADDVHAANQWVARGEGPDWRGLVGGQSMQWQEKGMDNLGKPVPLISEEVPGVSVSFQTLSGNARELWVSPEDCFARSSGDYYHRTARLIRNGETLTGCAYRGLLP